MARALDTPQNPPASEAPIRLARVRVWIADAEDAPRIERELDALDGWAPRSLGKLPGDLRIERENLRVYVPITTSLLVSGA